MLLYISSKTFSDKLQAFQVGVFDQALVPTGITLVFVSARWGKLLEKFQYFCVYVLLRDLTLCRGNGAGSCK